MVCSDGSWSMSQVVEISLPSSLVNLLNFVVFDVLLISLVFYFTTEISGRLNYLSLTDGLPRRLQISCPPIVGGGLCSTSRTRIYSLLFIRIMSLVLIFSSNLAIDGRSTKSIVKKQGLRRVPGTIDNFTNEQFRDAIDRRTSCQTSSRGFIHFGELRENDKCEFRLNLLTDEVSLSVEQKNLTVFTRSCDLEDENFPDRPKFTYRTFRCENARLQCIIRKTQPVGKQFMSANCRGVVQVHGETHVCEIFNKRQGDMWIGDCRAIRNFDLTNEDWLPGLFRGLATITETIGATTVARVANATLKSEGGALQITQVHHAWFALLGAKVMLVLVLGLFTAYLIWMGARCVVHDERSLASLLTLTASRYGKSADNDSHLYLNVAKNGGRTTFWVSKKPIRTMANDDRHLLEEAIVRGDN